MAAPLCGCGHCPRTSDRDTITQNQRIVCGRVVVLVHFHRVIMGNIPAQCVDKESLSQPEKVTDADP